MRERTGSMTWARGTSAGRPANHDRVDDACSTVHGNSAKIRRSAQGIHWFDRSSGINILLSDVQVPPVMWHRAPRYVSIALTNACELKCPYCYAPKFSARLDRRSVVSWARELDRDGCLGVGFGGGEPTAHHDFAAICRAITCETQLAVTFTTHGHRITPDLVRIIRGSVHFVRVSMDGLSHTYERLRGRSFAQFCRHLSLIAEVAPFGINYVVNVHTIETLDEAVQFAAMMGASEFLLLPEQPTLSGTGIDAETANRLAAWISTARTPVRLAISKAGADANMPLASPYREESSLDAHVHVDAQGTVKRNAYANRGVPIKDSILGAIEALRAKEDDPL